MTDGDDGDICPDLGVSGSANEEAHFWYQYIVHTPGFHSTKENQNITNRKKDISHQIC